MALCERRRATAANRTTRDQKIESAGSLAFPPAHQDDGGADDGDGESNVEVVTAHELSEATATTGARLQRRLVHATSMHEQLDHLHSKHTVAETLGMAAALVYADVPDSPGGGDAGASKAPAKSSKSYNKLMTSFKGHMSKGVGEIRKIIFPQ